MELLLEQPYMPPLRFYFLKLPLFNFFFIYMKNTSSKNKVILRTLRPFLPTRRPNQFGCGPLQIGLLQPKRAVCVPTTKSTRCRLNGTHQRPFESHMTRTHKCCWPAGSRQTPCCSSCRAEQRARRSLCGPSCPPEPTCPHIFDKGTLIRSKLLHRDDTTIVRHLYPSGEHTTLKRKK